MDFNNFSMKELYDLRLKATYNLKIGNIEFAPGETIAIFDKITLANFSEIQSHVSARGGRLNKHLVFWDDTKGVNLSFSQGVFNLEQFSLLTNARIIEKTNNTIEITNRELIESDEQGFIELKEIPSKDLFIYDKETNEKILTYSKISDKKYKIDDPYKELVIDYQYLYNNNSSEIQIGERLINGFLSLEGRTKIKEDNTGKVKTGIIKVPKLKVMSDLSMRLGREASPVSGSFDAVALPSGQKGDTRVMQLILLEDDIDSDM